MIPADTAPEAAEALVLLQAFERPSKPPTVTSCSHSEGQGSTGSQHMSFTTALLQLARSAKEQSSILLRHGQNSKGTPLCLVYYTVYAQ